MAAIGNLIGRLLYPQGAVCLACGRMRVDVPEASLCAACMEKLALLDGQACITAPFGALDGLYSAYLYGQTARLLVRAVKYNGVVPAASALADGMASVLPSVPVDALVPVPLHRSRQRTRGFNQARVLCDALAARTGLPVLDALARTRATRTQTQLTREGRAENVRDAFAPVSPVAEMRLLLIDDVLTTGATAQACAAALKANGAAKLWLLTAAKAPENADV